jgi:predicted AlkP superfamily phosphohydrolase/phosphomutase
VKSFRRVLVVGLDGLEPSIVERLIEAGQLPNLARLMSQGSYARIATTYPAQTPVAWSTFATGVNPGGHGIFDFIRPDRRTYRAELALNRYHQASAFSPPKPVNLRRGTPFWQTLSEAGIPSVVLRCPCTYPPDAVRGRLLSGMGVPDLRGGFGTSSFYSTEPGIEAGESEIVHCVSVRDGQISTILTGPRNPRGGKDFECALKMTIDSRRRQVHVQSSEQAAGVIARLGAWSDWLHVKFKASLFVTIRGMVRFHLVALEPHLKLHASPVNFDPVAPLFPISSPNAYSKELAGALGDYYTTGMVEDHGGLNNGRIDEAAFLDQCHQVVQERERMMIHELERLKEGFFFVLFDTPDRLQHMFWRFVEPDHPAAHHPAKGDWRHAIDEHYRQCDQIVGRALEYADDRTLLMVLSDHGFGSFRRGLNLNSWLREEGLLTQRGDKGSSDSGGEFFPGVDWTHTRAYSLGLAGIYLNIAGREGQGIVPQGEAAALRRQIAERLSGLVDPGTGEVAVRSALPREAVYAGPYVEEAPDVIVNFARGYRMSWATALGGVPRELWEENDRRWSGDHIVDPELVPGVIFMNQPSRNEAPRLFDMAPTILSALGVSRGAGSPPIDGRGAALPESALAETLDAPTADEIARRRLEGLGYI